VKGQRQAARYLSSPLLNRALNKELGELGAVLSPGGGQPELVIPTGVCRAAPAVTTPVFQEGEPISWDDLSMPVGERVGEKATSLVQPHSLNSLQGCPEGAGPCPAVLHAPAHPGGKSRACASIPKEISSLNRGRQLSPPRSKEQSPLLVFPKRSRAAAEPQTPGYQRVAPGHLRPHAADPKEEPYWGGSLSPPRCGLRAGRAG